MKAIVYDRTDSGDVLALKDVGKPVPKDDEVLIKIHAASVNPFDYHFLKHRLVRRFIAKARKVSTIRPGGEGAGEVEAVGKNVKQFKPGDAVFGPCQGAFAEYACARESALVTKPANVSFEQAAATPVAALTALQALRDKAHVQQNQKVLINGAAGGVGTFAVQIAKVLGAEVTAVCSTRNVELVRSLGADNVIDYTQQDFTRNDQHYDVIFDVVANHSFSALRRALTPHGIYIGAGMLGRDGSILTVISRLIPPFVMSPFISQKFPSFMAKVNQGDLSTIIALIAEGRVRPVIDRCFSLSEAAEAVTYVENRHARGKVIICVQPSAAPAHH